MIYVVATMKMKPATRRDLSAPFKASAKIGIIGSGEVEKL